jgi:NADPH:quinone reductase-like Zn-dependent oxidoreductase
MQIQSGQKILINGAGGGVGTFAVQIAKNFGAEVTAVDKSNKLNILRSLGADHVIDYTSEDFTRNNLQYDLILDVIAHRSVFDYKRALSSGGRYVMIGGSVGIIFQVLIIGSFLSLFGKKKLGILVHKPNKGLDLLNKLFTEGKIVPVIDSQYQLSDIRNAFQHFGTGDVKGKVVISVCP